MATLQTIIGISLLIFLHELGHFGLARLFKMRVLRFSVGFGPALIQRRFGDTIWQIAVVPLGGYVQIHGMGPSEEVQDEDHESYANRPWWQRMLVIFAGPGANWVVAAVCLTFALMVGYGRPDLTSRIGEVVPDSAAAEAGLQPNDRITRIGEHEIETWLEMVDVIRANPGVALPIHIHRDGQLMELSVTPTLKDDVGKLGVGQASNLERQSPGDALSNGVGLTWKMTVKHASLLWGLIAGRSEGRLAGLPGIVKMVSRQARAGFGRLLQSLAWLSIGLCLLNLAPLPALDGGRLLFLTLEMLRGRRVDEQIEQMTHAIGFLLLLGLLVFVSIRDLL